MSLLVVDDLENGFLLLFVLIIVKKLLFNVAELVFVDRKFTVGVIK